MVSGFFEKRKKKIKLIFTIWWSYIKLYKIVIILNMFFKTLANVTY